MPKTLADKIIEAADHRVASLFPSDDSETEGVGRNSVAFRLNPSDFGIDVSTVEAREQLRLDLLAYGYILLQGGSHEFGILPCSPEWTKVQPGMPHVHTLGLPKLSISFREPDLKPIAT